MKTVGNFFGWLLLLLLLGVLFYGIHRGWDGPPEPGPHPKRVDPRF